MCIRDRICIIIVSGGRQHVLHGKIYYLTSHEALYISMLWYLNTVGKIYSFYICRKRRYNTVSYTHLSPQYSSYFMYFLHMFKHFWNSYWFSINLYSFLNILDVYKRQAFDGVLSLGLSSSDNDMIFGQNALNLLTWKWTIRNICKKILHFMT